jgi:hypothetical protein
MRYTAQPISTPGAIRRFKKQDPIAQKQCDNIERITTERDVLSLFGASRGAVMLQMTAPQKTFRPMEQPSMIGVFERIPPHHTDRESHDPVTPIRRVLVRKKNGWSDPA